MCFIDVPYMDNVLEHFAPRGEISNHRIVESMPTSNKPIMTPHTGPNRLETAKKALDRRRFQTRRLNMILPIRCIWRAAGKIV